MRIVGMMVVLALVAGCGGGAKRSYSGQVTRFASGPISKACLASDRKARNSQLCGCIQTVANRELSRSDQKMAVSFYKDPHKAQEVRQSDRGSHELFWKRYKSYSTQAEASCRGY
ncbi:hypothetical protein [Puniceibacterium sp. IMCC21224]|uniref:hypothetical protein n=1 Tax=Puniceibacterium sp. IMCC21224 TaxID=1618204 RepID=UPI00064DA948|nr:hypothetical protein [Puniceibacterium sp. IMCC21224]KMK68291.1 hypothetical protein IMCC21224_113172 [Puniceibacterium sp. IMCC21224]